MIVSSGFHLGGVLQSELLKLSGGLAISIAGPVLTEEESGLLMREEIAALVLFTRNIVNEAQLDTLVTRVRGIRPNLILFIDNEGMDVGTDLRQGIWRCLDACNNPIEPFSPPPSHYSIAKKYEEDSEQGLQMAYDSGQIIAAQLHKWRIISFGTVLCSNPDNKAPWAKQKSHQARQTVVDAAPGQALSQAAEESPESPTDQGLSTWVIAGLARSFGANVEQVFALCQKRKEGMASVSATPFSVKHYPDNGCSDGDPHDLLSVVDNRSMKEILPYSDTLYRNLKPDIIMTAHVRYTAEDSIDPDNIASLSPVWLDRVRLLQPDALVVSDCFNMGAIKKSGLTLAQAVSRATKCTETGGMTDLVLVCNKTVEEIYTLLGELDYQPNKASKQRLNRLQQWSQDQSSRAVPSRSRWS